MKKRTLKHVLDGFRSSSSTQQHSSARVEHVAIQETLRSEHFQVAKTVRHGFPYQPTAMAFDPIQKVLAIGTKHGSIRFIGCPGVDAHVCHESEASVLFLMFLVNEGALVSATADSTLHMWNYRQKKPEVIHSVKFQRERITSVCLPFQSKWLYVGSDRGNVHVVNTESFTLSGYIINWNKAIDLSRKSHPGAVVHVSDCPVDPGKLLIGFETGQLVIWDLKTRTADCRYQTAEPLRSVSWHHEGKQFMCSHTDGSLTTWIVKQPSNKATSTIFPHAKTNKDGKPESCKSIQKVDWTSCRTGESFIVFSGGLTNDRAGRTPSITVIHGKTTTVLEMEHNVVDFITLCEGTYPSDYDEPYALVVLLHNDLVVVDLLSPGYPCFENPYSMDLHESPVTCCIYLADCPLELIPAFYSVGARSHKSGFSNKEWPISGGEWGSSSCSYPELIITGHADGSLKFWDASSVGLQVLYKLKTAKVFEKDKSRSSSGGDGSEEDPFAIQHISMCPESRLLCVAGASSHLILYKYSKTETLAEVACLEIPIVYDVYDASDISPECEFPPRQNLQTSLDYFLNIHVRGGIQKKPPGYQAELVCLTPWVNGEPPGQITSLSVNSSYGLIAYGNESGLVIVDYIQNTCLLNMGTPELYGAADPYQRAPRSPKKPDSKDKDDERDRSPSSDQEQKDGFYPDQVDASIGAGSGCGSREELLASVKPMKRIESRGRGELDLQKNMIRKYSRVRSIDESQKPPEQKLDIIKFLTRKDHKQKKEDKAKDNDAEQLNTEQTKDDEYDDYKLENENDSDIMSNYCPPEKSDDILLEPCEEGATIQVKVEEIEITEANDTCRPVIMERKSSRFRLKDTFSKFDAKVRRAFSWDTGASMDEPSPPNSSRTTNESNEDCEVAEEACESPLEIVSEDQHRTDDDEHSNRSERQRSIGSVSEGGSSSAVTLSDGNNGSEVEGVPRRVSLEPAAASEDEVTSPLLTREAEERRGSKVKPSLELFDEDGRPIPPPRRNVANLADNYSFDANEAPPLSTDSNNSTKSSSKSADGSSSSNIATQIQSNIPEAKGHCSEGNSPCNPQVVNPTSPTSLGAFRSFMNTITKKTGTNHDKLDSSFSRSRSSSISSLENISSESIQCLAFAESYIKKNDAQMLPTLWVGTNLGSVIQVIVSIPSSDTRQTNPLSVFPSGTIFRLKGSILTMGFLDVNGALIKNNYESWKDSQKDKKDRTPTKSSNNTSCSSSTVSNKLSPTNSASSSADVTPADRQYIVFCSEKVARTVALPSQNCVYKQIITEVSFVVKAEIIQIKDAVCLVCYVATGHICIFNVPSLRQLTYVDFLPLVDLRIARTFCFTTHGHGMYLCSPSEVQKFTFSAEVCKELQELLGNLFLPCEMPEPPKQSFFKGLFGGGVSQLDREELFGEQSGKPASSVAKHIPGPMAAMDAANMKAGSTMSEVSRAKMAAVERGQRLNELGDKTEKMMHEAENISSAARQLMLKYKDKKWYQL